MLHGFRVFVARHSIALLALFVALGGSSYAAAKLPKNSVGSRQLRKNAVTSSKVKNHSLLASDFKSGQLPSGARGLAGPAGPKGDPGAQGPPGPSTGAAGGDLSGSYPNPAIAPGAVTTSKIGTIPAARVSNSADEPIPTGTQTDLTFDTVQYDTDALHGAIGFLTAPVAGVYAIATDVIWSSDSTAGARVVYLRKNGSTVAQSIIGASPVFNPSQSLATDVRMNVGDTVSVGVLQSSGGSLNILHINGITDLTMHWVAP